MSSILTLAGNNTSDASFYPHTIDQSLRFEDGDSPYLNRNLGADGNKTTWTFSTWVKRNSTGLSEIILASGNISGTIFYTRIGFSGTDRLGFYIYNDTNGGWLFTDRLFRDTSSWYHLVFVFDTSNSTSTDRMRIYVNGVRETSFVTVTFGETYPALNGVSSINESSYNHRIGRTENGQAGANHLNSYLADTHFVDGLALTGDSFGETKDGIWIPKEYVGSYGTQGWHLDYADSSDIGNNANTTDGTNDWTPSGLAATDVVPDSPTNNFATLNSLHPNASSGNFSEGNLRVYQDQSPYTDFYATIAVSAGKWYWEGRAAGTAVQQVWGFAREDALVTGNIGAVAGATGYAYFRYGSVARERANGSNANASGTLSVAAGDIIGLALNLDDNEVKFYKNGTLEHTITGVQDGTYYPFVIYQMNLNRLEQRVNFGQDSTFAGLESAGGNSDDNGIGDFAQSPISEHLAICSANLPEPAIISGEDYFNTVLYTGNSGTQSITGVGFQADWVWNKVRNHTYSHASYDSVRGTNQRLYQNHVYNEDTDSGLTSFDADGFTLGSAAGANASGKNYVSWNWKAGGSAVSNSDGTITSSISANPEAGFSIVSWSGTSSAGTVGHGLGKVPSMYIVKNRTGDYFWAVYHSGLTNPATSYIELNNNVGQSTSQTHWNSTAPTDAVFSVNNQLSVNNSSHTYIAYCFADIEGYCKAGSYTGANASDNTYVHLGFRPAWVMCKSYTQGGSGYDWVIYDNKRSPANPVGFNLEANNNIDDESVRGVPIDFLSNGFKIRNSYAEVGSNKGYIYLAFAEQPAKFSNAR